MTNQPLGNMIETAMDKIRAMVETNTVIGTPITTPDGMTSIPVSRVTFGFASGGNDSTASPSKPGVWGGSGAGVKVEPIGFLMVRDGNARLVSIQSPACTVGDRMLDILPDVMDRLESYVEKFTADKNGK